ncbi:MAG: GTP 3',8-cyclase MoaA, partial [Anaerolineae bacterium]|jgi:cyclic pyranopterin phosphate synthase
LGISKVRLTGGEPLVRLGIVELVHKISRIDGIDDLAITTNGVLLARHAEDLAQAGLRRVNISLDTLDPERFRRTTRGGELSDVLAGIEAARDAGLSPIKINTVVIRDLNDDEVVSLAAKTLDAAWWNIRFIELMPIGNGALMNDTWEDKVVTAREIQDRIEADLGELQPVKMKTGNGPARYHRLPGAVGTIGFITPVSDHFCYRCNRLRLTADGQLRPCLLSEREIDLRTPLRQGADADEIKKLIVRGINCKPMRHHLDERSQPQNRTMSEIGG